MWNQIVLVVGTLVGVYGSLQVYDFMGCNALSNFLQNPNYRTDYDCMLSGFEIMPYLSIKTLEVATALECQQHCQRTKGCEFFTYVQPNSPTCSIKTNMCYLKPAPGIQTSVQLTIRRIAESSIYIYISGLKRGCVQTCTDFDELKTGCGVSSPVTCSLQNTQYQTSVLSKAQMFTTNLFTCCNSSGIDNQYVNNAYTTKTTRTISSMLYGITSVEECHTRCLVNPECTSFNYVAAKMTHYIGGACYLMNLQVLNNAEFTPIRLPDTKSVSGIRCTKDGLCLEKPLTPSQSVFLQDPIPGTCQYKNIDLQHIWSIQHDISDLEACRLKCEFSFMTCLYYMWKWNKCFLAYSNADYTYIKNPADESIVGLQDCKITLPQTCALIDAQYTGDELSSYQYSETAKICLEVCNADGRCNYWSYSNKTCHTFATVQSSAHSIGFISAPKTCKLN